MSAAIVTVTPDPSIDVSAALLAPGTSLAGKDDTERLAGLVELRPL